MVSVKVYDTSHSRDKLPVTVIVDSVVTLAYASEGSLTVVATFLRGATSAGVYYTLLSIQPKFPKAGYVSRTLGFRRALGKGNRYNSKWESLDAAMRNCGIEVDAEDAYIGMADAANALKKLIALRDDVDPGDLYVVETTI